MSTPDEPTIDLGIYVGKNPWTLVLRQMKVLPRHRTLFFVIWHPEAPFVYLNAKTTSKLNIISHLSIHLPHEQLQQFNEFI